MKLLDLFCSAGGASTGYARAGFNVVGVDVKPQKRYPFEFHQADAMTFPLDGFDVVAASPPCQAYSVTHRCVGPCHHPRLIEPLRDRLIAWGGLYVIENVPGAPLRGGILFCGAAFGLGAAGRPLRRHRLFETNALVMSPGCGCGSKQKIGVYGHGSNGGSRGYQGSKAETAEAMGIDWMTRDELTQAIPPAYTETIGAFLADQMNLTARAR